MEKAGKKAKDSAKPKKNVAKVAKLPKDLREKRGLFDGAADDQEEDEEQAELDAIAAKFDFDAETERDLDKLSMKEARELVKKEHPEFAPLLKEHTSQVNALFQQVLPLLERAKTCPSLSGKGMDFLQAKHGLTLTYLVNLSYYILLKMRGVPVKGHPVLEELVKLRTLMEKMKPIDQKLQYQVEKLLKAHEGKEQPATQRLRANLEGMGKHDAEDDKEEIEDAAEDDGIYRPPKIASAMFSDENERMKADKELEKKKTRLKKSEMLRALREEFSEAPLEIGGFVEDADLRKVNTSLAQKTKFEEDNMRRLNLSKADKKKVRTLRAERKEVTGAASLAEVGDFSELAADLDGERGGRRKSALAEYRNASKQAQEVRSMKSADYNVDCRDPSKVMKREEKTASSHRVQHLLEIHSSANLF